GGRRRPTARRGARRGAKSSSVQRAVADAEGVQARQVRPQALFELLPALLGGAPGALGEGAHARERHVLHLLGGGHVLRPELALQAHHKALLAIVQALRGEGRGVHVLERGATADRERLIGRIALVVVEVGVLIVGDDRAEAAGGRGLHALAV